MDSRRILHIKIPVKITIENKRSYLEVMIKKRGISASFNIQLYFI